MGLYDYLVADYYDSQIKCFYLPSYSNRTVWHTGGHLESYRVGDEVPLHTQYYDYPDNFYVYLGEMAEYKIAVFGDGKFAGFIHDIVDANEFTDYYTYYGEKIKVKDASGLIDYENAIVDEYKKPPGTRNFVVLREQWHETLSLDHQLGELFECWSSARNWASLDSDDDFVVRQRKNYEDIVIDICIFRDEHPDVFDAFVRKHDIKWEVVI